MAKKPAVPEPVTFKCTMCTVMVTPDTYAEHIRQFHSQPAAPAPALPQAAAPVTQPAAHSAPPAARSGNSVRVTPPPPPAPRNPFINARVLYANGGTLTGVIIGVRSATGVRSKKRTDIADKPGWFLDLHLDREVEAAVEEPQTGRLIAVRTTEICGRVNEGDKRHTTLWDKYQDRWVGQHVTLRLPMPVDDTKAEWLIE